MANLIVSPSIMASLNQDWPTEIAKAYQAKTGYLHIDIMDGHFVPGKFGDASFVKKIASISPLFNDVHIMIQNPTKQIQDYLDAGSDALTFHLEASPNQEETLKAIHQIQKAGKKAGLSIKPATPIKALLPYLKELDVVLLMSVEPGKSGQSFMVECLPRIEELARYRKEFGAHFQIEVDGGINLENAKLVKQAGADIVVTGSYFFRSEEYLERAKAIMEL